MGTNSRSNSATRSRSLKDSIEQLNPSFPETFGSQSGNMATASLGAASPHIKAGPDTSQQSFPSPPLYPTQQTQQMPLLTINDLKAVATDIKETFSAAITELRRDIHTINGRILSVEKMAAQHDTALKHTNFSIDAHTLQLRDLNRHLEDLDNRGRRHNLRIRGLPETIDRDQLENSVINLFNNLLDRPPLSPIQMERIHRALRPKGRESDPPRDVICCIVDFQLKEEILRAARNRTRITHDNSVIKIFQDLSAITLRHRRDLRPLLEVLNAQGIHYRWRFPFCLYASFQGKSAYLKVPEDLPLFCSTLNIPLIDVPNWYSEYRPPNRAPIQPREEPMEAQESRFRRQRSPSEARLTFSNSALPPASSPTEAPQPRRARRDQ